MTRDNRTFPHDEYNKILSSTIEQIKNLGLLKGAEYSGDVDRLANFRRNAENLGLDYRQVWAVYSGKHWDALMQYVKDIGTGTERRRLESLSGRCDDLIVYLMLFKAMLKESEETTGLKVTSVSIVEKPFATAKLPQNMSPEDFDRRYTEAFNEGQAKTNLENQNLDGRNI